MVKRLENIELPKSRRELPSKPTREKVNELLNYIGKEFEYIEKTMKIDYKKLYQPMTI